MSDSYGPVEPRISGRTRLPRPALATVLFAGVLVVMLVISAAVRLDQSTREPAAAAGATAAPSAAAPGANASASPKADRKVDRGSARAWRSIKVTAIAGDQVS